MYVSQSNLFCRMGERGAAAWSLVADDQSGHLQLQEDAADYDRICVEDFGHILGPVQLLRLGGEQNERVDGGYKSVVERHGVTLSQLGGWRFYTSRKPFAGVTL